MSTTALAARGPNKALFRATALGGSAIIWGTLGYMALTYVPKYERPKEIPDRTILATPDLPIVIPPPPIVKPDPPPPPKNQTTQSNPTEATSPPVVTVYQPNTTRTNPLLGVSPAGPAPAEPASAGTEAQSPPPIAIPMPTTIDIPTIPTTIPEPVELAPPPPAPKLIVNPVRQAGANPEYPSMALNRDISGEATLSFTVTPEGKVENISVIGESPSGYGFARAARAAIVGWTFQPQTIDGVPVAYPARYTFSFKLED